LTSEINDRCKFIDFSSQIFFDGSFTNVLAIKDAAPGIQDVSLNIIFDAFDLCFVSIAFERRKYERGALSRGLSLLLGLFV
jgi:hypothetical protein